MEESAYVLVYKSDVREDARMIQEMLVSYGIDARTIGHQARRKAEGIHVLDAPTEYHVLVAEEQHQQARAILDGTAEGAESESM
jgi:hypothetical protein